MCSRITEIIPTVFFVEDGKDLRQKVDVAVQCSSITGNGKIRFEQIQSGLIEEYPVGDINTGESVFEIYVPDFREECSVTISLLSDSCMLDKVELDWVPKRHWRVHLIQLSHHDLGYTDLPKNVLEEFSDFYEQVVDFCEETQDFPDESKFKYVAEQSWSLLHFLKTRPKQVTDKAIKLLQEGRVEVTALFGNVTSELCGHEQMIRLLYPSFRLKREYGIPICSAELNDIPGMSWGLPSVLHGAGIKYFAPKIPDYFNWFGQKFHYIWDENEVMPWDMPGAFIWEGIDGARILVGIHDWTDWPWDYEHAMERYSTYLDELENRGYKYDILAFRHFGGSRDNCPPSVRSSYIAREWNLRWAYPQLIVSTNRQYFEELERVTSRGLPVFRGELPNTDYTVAFASMAKSTGVNRNTHDQLLTAEKFATIASGIVDYDFPGRTISDAYQEMCYYDFHCLGMESTLGYAQDTAWSENVRFAYTAAALTEDALQKSINLIADNIECTFDGYQVTVFNSLACERSDIVRVSAMSMPACSRPMYWKTPDPSTGKPPRMVHGTAIERRLVNLPDEFFTGDSGIAIIDAETGERVPHQILKITDPYVPIPWASERYALGQKRSAWLYDIVFEVKRLPSMGYKTYLIQNGNEGSNACGGSFESDSVLENKFYRIEFDIVTGAVLSIFDKELGEELVDGHADHHVNQFIIRHSKSGNIETSGRAVIQRGADGPLCSSVLVYTQAIGCPRIVQEILLYHNEKRIDFNNRLLKDSTPLIENYFAFPFRVDNPEFKYESSNSVIEPLVDQFPGSNTNYYAIQHWAEVSNSRYGIAVSSLDAANFEFSRLWVSFISQAHHCVTPPGLGHEFAREGDFEKGHMYCFAMVNNFGLNFYNTQVSDVIFRFSMTSYAKTEQETRRVEHGWRYHFPLVSAYTRGTRTGSLKVKGEFCTVDKQNVEVLTIKPAENGNGYIVRLLERQGIGVVVKLSVCFIDVERACLTNLVEEDEQFLVVENGAVAVAVPAYSVRTVRIIPVP